MDLQNHWKRNQSVAGACSASSSTWASKGPLPLIRDASSSAAGRIQQPHSFPRLITPFRFYLPAHGTQKVPACSLRFPYKSIGFPQKEADSRRPRSLRVSMLQGSDGQLRFAQKKVNNAETEVRIRACRLQGQCGLIHLHGLLPLRSAFGVVVLAAGLDHRRVR